MSVDLTQWPKKLRQMSWNHPKEKKNLKTYELGMYVDNNYTTDPMHYYGKAFAT
jgi:hypothetical protein